MSLLTPINLFNQHWCTNDHLWNHGRFWSWLHLLTRCGRLRLLFREKTGFSDGNCRLRIRSGLLCLRSFRKLFAWFVWLERCEYDFCRLVLQLCHLRILDETFGVGHHNFDAYRTQWLKIIQKVSFYNIFNGIWISAPKINFLIFGGKIQMRHFWRFSTTVA